MALIGNCTHTVYTNHATETTTESVTLSDGKVTTEQVPVIVETPTDYTNIFVCIKQVENINFWDGINTHKSIHYQFAGYTDKATRDADQEDFLFWETSHLISYDHTSNLYEQIYNDIKAQAGFTNLTND
jgi:hypothetical protein